MVKATIEQELNILEKVGMLKKIDFSDWATPVVVVPKKDGRVRLCGDYKVTINPVIDVAQYSFSCSEDPFATLAGDKNFTILDLSMLISNCP